MAYSRLGQRPYAEESDDSIVSSQNSTRPTKYRAEGKRRA
jgi:hypothetical protein